NSHYYVKRGVGLPGETVQIIGGSVFINGVVLEETYDFISEAGIAEKELVLKTDEYFVLGDNRNNSEDSRSSTIGAVSSDSIIGKVWLHYPYGEATFGFVD
ncbi:MAG: signal peptidase I, partial [Eubacteriales bacterium]